MGKRIEPGPGCFKNDSDRYAAEQGVEWGDSLHAKSNAGGTAVVLTGAYSGTDIRWSGGHNVETLSDDKVLTSGDARMQKLDPGGADRDVDLPAEAISDGIAYHITNAADADEDLVVKDDGGSTIVTIPQNRAAWVVCNGTAWVHMGIQTIALS
jgi:hypothetical protein